MMAAEETSMMTADNVEEVDIEMSAGEHFEELRDRGIFALIVTTVGILVSFGFSKDIVRTLQDPVAIEGVKFVALSPSDYLFTTVKVSAYSGLFVAAPIILTQIANYILPGLTKSEIKTIGPVILGSAVMFYIGLAFGYEILSPAALKFFLSFADGAVESVYGIDEYISFVAFMTLSTGIAFQVPVVQTVAGVLGILSSQQMFSAWRYVIIGAVVAAAILTPSTDPLTQMLLAVPLIGLYFGGAWIVRFSEQSKSEAA
jgi:sec-independent protein translocase protein TatC